MSNRSFQHPAWGFGGLRSGCGFFPHGGARALSRVPPSDPSDPTCSLHARPTLIKAAHCPRLPALTCWADESEGPALPGPPTVEGAGNRPGVLGRTSLSHSSIPRREGLVL